jgi:hypothetical protein
MPFHVEVSSSIRHARSFNLGAEDLRLTVLKPWLAGRSIELGDRKWDPDECELRVLEGPELSNPELSFGQAWANAERASEDVTRRVLDAAFEAQSSGGSGPAAMVIETDSAVGTLAELVSGRETRSVNLEEIGERIDGRDPAVAAVIVVIQRQAPGHQ